MFTLRRLLFPFRATDSLLQQAIQVLIELGIFADNDFGNLAFLVEHNLGGIAFDGIHHADVRVAGIAYVNPRECMGLDGSFQESSVSLQSMPTISSLFLYFS